MAEKIIKPGLVLLIITAIAAALLGFVDGQTKQRIAEEEKKALDNAKKEVLSSAEGFEDEIIVEGDSIIKSYSEGKASGETVGYAFSVSTKGFSSGLNLMIGIDKEGKVSGVNVVSHEETPGLGANAKTNPSFVQQYIGKQAPLEVTKSGNASDTEINAITGATITSRAVTEAVNEVSEYYNNEIIGKGGNK